MPYYLGGPKNGPYFRELPMWYGMVLFLNIRTVIHTVHITIVSVIASVGVKIS